MFGPDSDGVVSARPVAPAAGTPGWFQDGDPTVPRRPTLVRDWFLNGILAELRSLLAFVGLAENKGRDDQVLEVVQRIAGATGPRAVFATAGTFAWVVPLGVYRIHVRLVGGGGPGGHGYTGAGGGGSAGGGWNGVIATVPGETLAVDVATAGMAGNTAGTAATGGGTSTLRRGAAVLAQATGGSGGGGGGPGTGGVGNLSFGHGIGDNLTTDMPTGESGQNGVAIPALLIGGKGGSTVALNGGAAQMIATPGNADGNGAQTGCGGGGGVGNGLGGNGGGGLVIIEYGTPTP